MICTNRLSQCSSCSASIKHEQKQTVNSTDLRIYNWYKPGKESARKYIVWKQQLHVHFSLKCLSLSLFIGDTSASTSDDHSPLLWISVAVAGVLLFVMVLLILVIYKKNRNAAFRVEKEVK